MMKGMSTQDARNISESEFRHETDRNLTFMLLEVIEDKIWATKAKHVREPKRDALYWDWCIILYI